MSDLEAHILDELRRWSEANPFPDAGEVHESIAAIAERAAPEGADSTALEERLWEEWRFIEEERAGRFGP